MTTRMVHPQHGATHAYDPGEVAKLQGLGWAVEKPAENALQVSGVGPLASLPKNAFEVPQRKKPGPKPKAK